MNLADRNRLITQLNDLYLRNAHDQAHNLITQVLYEGVDEELEGYLSQFRRKLDQAARQGRRVPKEVQNVLLDFCIAPEKLWNLDLPLKTISSKALGWHLNIPFFWSQPNGFYDVTPRQVIDNPKLLPYEYHKMQICDLSHPIDIYWHKGRWLILDGLHRFMKHVSLHHPEIQVRKVPKEKLLRIKR